MSARRRKAEEDVDGWKGAEMAIEMTSTGMQDWLGLTPEEDDLLRRLHWFETAGCELSEDQRLLKASLRIRDRRAEIRLPRQLAYASEFSDPGLR